MMEQGPPDGEERRGELEGPDSLETRERVLELREWAEKVVSKQWVAIAFLAFTIFLAVVLLQLSRYEASRNACLTRNNEHANIIDYIVNPLGHGVKIPNQSPEQTRVRRIAVVVGRRKFPINPDCSSAARKVIWTLPDLWPFND